MLPINFNEADYQSDFLQEEKAREERLHLRVIKTTMNKLRRALRMEVLKGEEISEGHRDRFILTPLEFMSKAFVKISLTNLYRRYRQIRIQALTECLAIVGSGSSRDENLEAIRAKICELGMAHKASIEREESKKNKCAAY